MIFSDTRAKIIISTTISLSFLEIDIYLLHVSQVLGDVVLNHRCAHKQSAYGVWNIFGGKLA
ncbi:putative alpha-amylase [Helianthus anomalus]